jgi:hypothetical protein
LGDIRNGIILNMPRKRNVVEEGVLTALKSDVELKCGFPIRSSKDCTQLSKLIFTATKHHISVNTLRRFFSLEKSRFSVSHSTMEILGKYVSNIMVPEAVLDFEVAFVIDFFRPHHFESIDYNDKSFQASCRKIAVLINGNVSLFQRVMDFLGTNKMGQKFYFDLFPDYDILPLFQYKGYEIYWENTQDRNDRLYVASLLTRAFYFRGEHDKVLLWKSRAMSLYDSNSPDFHSFTLGRFFFAVLVSSQGSDYQKWVSESKTIEQKIARDAKDYFNDFPGFHYLICDAFYLKSDYTSLLYFAQKALTDFKEYAEFSWKGYYDQLRIFRAVALFHLDNDSEVRKEIMQIDTSKFYFISRNYFHAIHQRLMNEVKERVR